jgi:hypothetical protein
MRGKGKETRMYKVTRNDSPSQVVAGSLSCFSIVHLKDINWRLRNNRLQGYKSGIWVVDWQSHSILPVHFTINCACQWYGCNTWPNSGLKITIFGYRFCMTFLATRPTAWKSTSTQPLFIQKPKITFHKNKTWSNSTCYVPVPWSCWKFLW